MSYAEHGPRIFLTGRPSSGVPLTYGDYILPQKRSEGRLKLYNSCTDIRAWSPNVLESTRYFRELNEHDRPTPGKLIPFNVVMENMIALTTQAQRELRVARRELRGYRSLNLTPEQRDHLEKDFVSFRERVKPTSVAMIIVLSSILQDRATGGTDKAEEMRIEYMMRPLAQEGLRLFNANRIASSRHLDAYMSIYFRPDRFRYVGDGRPLLTNTHVSRHHLNTHPLSENNTYLVSRVTSCDILTEVKATRGKSCKIQNYSLRAYPTRQPSLSKADPAKYKFCQNQKARGQFCLSIEFSLSNLKSTLKQSVANRAINFAERSEQASVCIEYVDASSQAAQDVREIGVQTEECKDDDAYDRQSNVDSPSSQYYETTESVSTSESELGINSDPEVCERSHKGVIIQKDSEIIVLKNELGMKEDELEELRELNRHLKTLLKEKDEDSNILRRNVNTLQEKLKIVSVRRDCETEDLSAKVSSFECLVDQLKAELARKCQVCYFQSQEIQKLRTEAKEAELLSMENESLTRKVREMEHLSREAESCGIALEQMKNVWRERDTLQKQYHEQSCALADREDEIKRLLTLIKQMSVTSDTREVCVIWLHASHRNPLILTSIQLIIGNKLFGNWSVRDVTLF
ncbi:uncharacterized protein [Temnothorax longispinosus]|uniref:uncharacterized protein n=1 Tax=Temnothorax longispinosus TaxID=300112 RepID=UPI003A99E944